MLWTSMHFTFWGNADTNSVIPDCDLLRDGLHRQHEVQRPWRGAAHLMLLMPQMGPVHGELAPTKVQNI